MVKVSGFEATELGPPPAAAWVALTEWPALVSGVVGVKFQVLPATVVVPATLPSMETVTMSPLTPDPEMVGSAVVVMMMPLVGAVMVGAVMVGGGGGDATGGGASGGGGAGGGADGAPKTWIGAAVAALLGPVKPKEAVIVLRRL